MIIFYNIVELLACFIEDWIGLLFGSHITDKAYTSWKKIGSCAIGLALVTWCMNQIQLFSGFTTIFVVVVLALMVTVLYKVNIIDALVYMVSYFILIYIVDFAVISLFGVIMKKEDMAGVIAGSYSLIRVVAMSLSKAILSGIYFFLVRKIPAKPYTNVWKIVSGVVIWCGIFWVLVRDSFSKVHTETLFTWLFIFLMAIYSGVNYLNFLREKDQMRLAGTQNQLLAEYYETVIENYRANQIFYHDLKSQYILLKNYLDNKDYDKARDYMKEMKLAGEKETIQMRTGMAALDVLLSYKISQAKKWGIHMEIVAVPINLQLTDSDIAALFGNAIDNALEACRNATTAMKTVEIRIRRLNDMTFITIVNTCEKQPKMQGTKFLSSKAEQGIHGLGMESMKMIVKKYGGTLETKYALGQFELDIAFFEGTPTT